MEEIIMIIEIIKLIISVLALFIMVVVCNRLTKIINSKYILQRDLEARSIKYSEDEILGHLNYIINEALNEYIIMNLKPKNVYYITNSMENEINTKLAEVIPLRISPTLYTQLQLIYDPDYIGLMIGTKIYMNVLEYVLTFNIENGQQNNYRDKK
jgi:hypothetical protein